MVIGFARFVTSLCLVVGVLGPGPALAAQTLAALATRAEQRGFRTGVVVRDLRSGRDLFRHRSQEAFLPASNQKLVTAAAALWALGADYRFETVFRVRDGFLEVLAGGDPNWSSDTDHDPQRVFGAVVARLQKAGIRQLRGIRLVPGPFTGPRRPAGWPADQFARTYAAPTGGLVLEAGCFEAEIAPGPGVARVTMVAPPYDAVFEGRIAMSASRRAAPWLSHSGEAFRAHGKLRRGSSATTVRGVCQDPEWLFEVTLEQALQRGGIELVSTAPVRDQDVLVWRSELPTALAEMLIDSSNFHAEQLLRVLGAERAGAGTFDAGCGVVREVVGRQVPLPEAVQVVDGSGLSRGNRVTPQFLVQLIEELCKGTHAETFVECLPQGGVSGTLRSRFRAAGRRAVGRATRAKTGYVRGVRALSGLVQLPGGRVRLFSILMNRRQGSSTAGTKELQDAMVTAIYQDKLE